LSNPKSEIIVSRGWMEPMERPLAKGTMDISFQKRTHPITNDPFRFPKDK
jgi:hypothetical protein